MTDRPLNSWDDNETSLQTHQPLKRTVTNSAIFNRSPTKFATFITHSIATLTIGVATQNFFTKTVCVRLFNGGIVSISFLPPSTNLMAKDHTGPDFPGNEVICIATLVNPYRALLSRPRPECARRTELFTMLRYLRPTIHKVNHA